MLPPARLLDTGRLLLPLSEATTAAGRLDGISRQIERPEYLFKNYLRREAVLSSAIEGTRTTVAGLVLFDASARGDPDAQEVSNYVTALNYGLEALKQRTISKRFLNAMHQRLMEGSNRDKTTPGTPRRCLVQLGEGLPSEARFVPPPDIFVDELLDNLVEYLAAGNDVPSLVKIAIAHYEFEAIHPYRDGNGRLGRLLFMLYLSERKILNAPMLYVSAYLERHRREYYDLLLAISQKGAWEDWIEFFLKAVALQANDAVDRTAHLSELCDDYRRRVFDTKRPGKLYLLVDQLFVTQQFPLRLCNDRRD